VGQQISDLLKAPAAGGRAAEPTLSISQEAKRLLEAKKEAERERMQKAVQDMRERSAGLAELQKNSRQSQQDKKIAETKARLKELLARMRSALLMGDRHTAALLAKEASQLAKGLAAALKGRGGPAESGDAPVVVPQASGGEAAEGAESAEGIDQGAAEAAEGTEAAETTDAEGARAEADRAGKADQADAEERGRDGKPGAAEKSEKGENRAAASALAAYRKEMDAKAGESQGTGLSPAQRKEVEEIKQMLRAILSMAKSLLKRGGKGPGAEGAGAAEARKTVEAAEKDIEEAIEDIEEIDAA
jgi:colicin import membrane protein